MLSSIACYFAIDTSASMNGSALRSAEQGAELILSCLRLGVQPLCAIKFSLLTYGSVATVIERQVLPTALISHFGKFKAIGTSALGTATHMLSSWHMEDISYDAHWIFIFTDGAGTDIWWDALSNLKQKLVRIIIIECGEKTYVTIFKLFVDEIFNYSNMDDKFLIKTFQDWLGEDATPTEEVIWRR